MFIGAKDFFYLMYFQSLFDSEPWPSSYLKNK